MAGTRTLSESESAELVARYGVRIAPSRRAASPDEAVAAAEAIGYPVVVKLHAPGLAHKSEHRLVRLGLAGPDVVRAAAEELLSADLLGAEHPDADLLVARMVRGARELVAGLHTDAQFGRCVMVGIGGVLTEAIGDVAFRLVPFDAADAHDALDQLRTQGLLDEWRGEPPVDRAAVVDVLLALARLAEQEPDVVSVDLNPLVVEDGVPVAVDALVETTASDDSMTDSMTARDFSALFDPRGVIVAGASSHPGKFGFVVLHNILRNGYPGRVFATNTSGGDILGLATARSVDDLPDGAADLALLCTPVDVNVDVLRACARKGVRAAFVMTGGYAETGEDGRRAEAELAAAAEECGILLAGPNGQGIVSTPASLCAQMVAPYPPAGRIGIASQSGNIVSSFENLAGLSGIGVSRAVSAGNAAVLGVGDYLEYFADDDATDVGLAYLENVRDGRALADTLGRVARALPVVLMRGGTTSAGQRAAVSHTGALASDERVFAGMCRQVGVNVAATAEEAYDAAATFATQPLPRGPNVAVLTTAGGWGVLTADAVTRSELTLAPMPADLLTQIDALLPPRWSRANPIDLAGSETRDTIPNVLALLAAHPGVDSIVFLGSGVQSNQAKLLRTGPYAADEGIERIVAFHERQDERYAQVAADVSKEHSKPVLVATELAVADPDNPGPRTVRATGRLCYSSAHRAVAALEHLWRRARFLHRVEARDAT